MKSTCNDGVVKSDRTHVHHVLSWFPLALIISCLLSLLMKGQHTTADHWLRHYVHLNVSEGAWEGPGPYARVLIWQHCSLQLCDSPAASAQLSERAHAPLSSFPWLSVGEQRRSKQTGWAGMIKSGGTALQVQFKMLPKSSLDRTYCVTEEDNVFAQVAITFIMDL